MEKAGLIQRLIDCSVRRAIREMGVCLLLSFVFGARAWRFPTASVHYAGCLILAIAPLFIAAVVWKFTLRRSLLQQHPVEDTVFWTKTFRAQARLLRLVPVWYLAPLAVGMILYAFPNPSGPEKMPPWFAFDGYLVFAFALFVAVTWINRSAATKLDEQARMIGG